MKCHNVTKYLDIIITQNKIFDKHIVFERYRWLYEPHRGICNGGAIIWMVKFDRWQVRNWQPPLCFGFHQAFQSSNVRQFQILWTQCGVSTNGRRSTTERGGHVLITMTCVLWLLTHSDMLRQCSLNSHLNKLDAGNDTRRHMTDSFWYRRWYSATRHAVTRLAYNDEKCTESAATQSLCDAKSNWLPG